MHLTRDILVVDDEVNIVNLVVDLLQDEGYQVRAALNGAAALAAISEQTPAMILMDMYMPQMTGIMLLEHLTQQGISNIPVVLMTASPRAAEQLLATNAVDYLAKPFDIDQLLECVARYVRPPASSLPPNSSAQSSHS
jgi:two-component system, OmpR family, alkaline phosphatase synthesis response regulator PhoP